MADIKTLQASITQQLNHCIVYSFIENDELTLEIASNSLTEMCLKLRDDPEFDFKLLVDLCGVDYLHYGIDEWATESTTTSGFSRGVQKNSEKQIKMNVPRFAVVYHLLSLKNNHRIRIRIRLDEKNPTLPSVIEIWPSANWYEREAFDLFGIQFTGHPDLRRILTDYGFVGHPFRKDFPLIGKVEARYDANQRQVIYEPVSIEPRVLEPKVIRHDTRYEPME